MLILFIILHTFIAKQIGIYVVFITANLMYANIFYFFLIHSRKTILNDRGNINLFLDLNCKWLHSKCHTVVIVNAMYSFSHSKFLPKTFPDIWQPYFINNKMILTELKLDIISRKYTCITFINLIFISFLSTDFLLVLHHPQIVHH